MRVRRRPVVTCIASGVVAAVTVVTSTVAVPAYAGTPQSWSVAGPAGSPVTARLALDDAGRLSLGIDLHGSTILAPAPVGITTTGADLTGALTFVSRADRTVRETYTMTTGKHLERDTTLTESTLAFSGTGGARLDVVVRVSAEGAAYRYVLPAGGTVTGEASSYTLPADAPAWLLPYTPNYEDIRVRTTAGAAATGDYGFPSLFRVGDDYVLLSESDMDGRYSGDRSAPVTA
jgi:alpha-glucosidase